MGEKLSLSSEHRGFARIEDRAVFIGVSNVVEVVGEQVWDTESYGLDPDTFTQLGDRIGRPGSPSAGERA